MSSAHAVAELPGTLASRSRWIAAAVLALLACSRRSDVGPSAEAAALPPPAAASVPVAPELPELERARLSSLFDAAERATRSWPELAADSTCILLIAEDRQWVVNCEVAPAGFARTPGNFRARPIFAQRGGTFEIAGQPRSPRALLEKTPAAAHVSDAGSAELPAGRPWLLLGTLEALRAFHPAFGPAVTESWLSVAMHEFVHIHQLRQPAFAAVRARIDAGALSPAALDAVYAADAGFGALVRREYQQLTAAAMQDLTPAAAGAALRRWLRSYRARSAHLARQPDGARLLESERVFTYLEGVARFVESDFLDDATQHPEASLAADPQFHAFHAFAGRGYAASPNRQLDEHYYYAVGYHVCVLLDRADPSWKQRVDKEPGWLIGLVERLAAE